MDILLRESGTVTIVDLIGELNSLTSAPAQAKVLAAIRPKGRMVLDMGRVSFMSSAGLRVLLMTHRSITGNGGQVVLANLPANLRDTLRAVGFLDLLTVRETLDDALAALTPQP